jgi:hypothetical protein
MYRDPLLQELAAQEVRPGATYLSPAHLMNYQKHWSGTPYWMQPAGIPYGQMYTDTFSAPAQPFKQGFIANGVQQSAVFGSGQAPTNGIYTGVEDSCG